MQASSINIFLVLLKTLIWKWPPKLWLNLVNYVRKAIKEKFENYNFSFKPFNEKEVTNVLKLTINKASVSNDILKSTSKIAVHVYTTKQNRNNIKKDCL